MSIKPNNKKSRNDAMGTLKAAYDDEAQAFRMVPGFLLYAPGRKIEVEYPNATTEQYIYKEDDDVKYVIEVVYTDSTKDVLSSVERIV
jgi:hypothetical protein